MGIVFVARKFCVSSFIHIEREDVDTASSISDLSIRYYV
jgi:hypothetical protein